MNGILTTATANAGDEAGFTLVELLVTIVILGLTFTVLTESFVLGLRTTTDTEASLAQSDVQQFVGLWTAKDVQAATTAATTGPACGIAAPALRATRASTATGAPDLDIAYSLSSNQLVRSTCPVGAGTAATTAVIADGVASFAATCGSPGACGTVHLTVQTTAGANTPSYQFTLGLGRRNP